MKEWFTKERITAWGQILLGCLLGAMAYPWFLVPNHIAPGGVTGLATVLNYLFGWPVGTASLLMNIPLFLLGYKEMLARLKPEKIIFFGDVPEGCTGNIERHTSFHAGLAHAQEKR